jgi:hypothetical protein
MEQQIKKFSLGEEFEKIIQNIFEKNGYKTEREFPMGKYKCDLLAKIDDINVYVEVKLYRNKQPNRQLIENACRQLCSITEEQDGKLVLTVPIEIIPSFKEEMLKKYNVTVWDAKTLFVLAFDFPELYYDLEALLTSAFNEPHDLSIIDKNSDEGSKEKILSKLKKAPKNTINTVSKENKGANLYKELEILKSGKGDAHKYENKCTEILKYLFENKTDLSLWNEQPVTDDKLHKFDLLCRINTSEKSNFWTELAYDFHTRYVLFEFKNYTDKIKQGQVYTTEKYLFLTALRSVAFIIAKNGADDNAIKAAKGALKEAGKLIVILTNDDINKMLIRNDNGDEPEIILRDKIDNILIELTR